MSWIKVYTRAKGKCEDKYMQVTYNNALQKQALNPVSCVKKLFLDTWCYH